MPFLVYLGITGSLIVAKLIGAITWPWVAVLVPIWLLPALVALAIAGVLFLVAGVILVVLCLEACDWALNKIEEARS